LSLSEERDHSNIISINAEEQAKVEKAHGNNGGEIRKLTFSYTNAMISYKQFR
jgi:hypothetical protein